jgi:hypothetical protein
VLLPLLKLKFLKLNAETAALRTAQLRMRRGVVSLLRHLSTHEQWMKAMFDTTSPSRSSAASPRDDGPPASRSIFVAAIDSPKVSNESSIIIEAVLAPAEVASPSPKASGSESPVTSFASQPPMGSILLKNVLDIFENELNAYLKEQQAAMMTAATVNADIPDVVSSKDDEEDPKQGYKFLFRQLSYLLQHCILYQSQLDESSPAEVEYLPSETSIGGLSGMASPSQDSPSVRNRALGPSTGLSVVVPGRAASTSTVLKALLPSMLCLLQHAADRTLSRNILTMICLYTHIGRGKGTQLLTEPCANISATASAASSHQIYPLAILMRAWTTVSDEQTLQWQIAETFSKVLLHASTTLQAVALRPVASPVAASASGFSMFPVPSLMGHRGSMVAIPSPSATSSTVFNSLAVSTASGEGQIHTDRRELLTKFLALVGGQQAFEKSLQQMMSGDDATKLHALYSWSMFLYTSTHLSGLVTPPDTDASKDYSLLRVGLESATTVNTLDATLFPGAWQWAAVASEQPPSEFPTDVAAASPTAAPHPLQQILKLAFTYGPSVPVHLRFLSWTTLCNLASFPSNHAALLHCLGEMRAHDEAAEAHSETVSGPADRWRSFNSLLRGTGTGKDTARFLKLCSLFLANLCAIPSTTAEVVDHVDFGAINHMLDATALSAPGHDVAVQLSCLQVLLACSHLSEDVCLQWLQSDGLWRSVLKLTPPPPPAVPVATLADTGKITWQVERKPEILIDERITQMIAQIVVQVTDYEGVRDAIADGE